MSDSENESDSEYESCDEGKSSLKGAINKVFKIQKKEKEKLKKKELNIKMSLGIKGWEKCTLLAKPEQSGKTFIMIQEIINISTLHQLFLLQILGIQIKN